MPHLEDDRDGYWAAKRVPGRFYVSQRFPYQQPDGSTLPGRLCRFAYQVFDANGEVVFEGSNGWEIVLRETPTRQQLKALFFEDDSGIERIAFQRFDSDGNRIVRESFRLEGHEVQELAAFLALVRSNQLDLAERREGTRLLPSGIDALLTDDSTRLEVFRRYRDVFVELMESEVEAPELIALARRRKQLEVFDALLNDGAAFRRRQAELQGQGRKSGPEDVWQDFFEGNRWIFGAGLATQFMHSWNPDRLEQTTVGASAFAYGKRPDALLRTAGAVSGLVFVEIKTHVTALVEESRYRPGVWAPFGELTSGVAQCQTTVDETVRTTERRLMQSDSKGFPTGESAVVCRPRSILVIGSLTQFATSDGLTNIEQFEGFERFRRSIKDPEIVTFDELYERARMVLELAEEDRSHP